MDRLESEELYERSDREGHLQLTQVFSRANSRPMTKTKMEDFFRPAALSRQSHPPFRNKVECGITGEGNAPVILVAIRMPDIQENMCSFGDQQAIAMRGFDPGIGSRLARKEIERRRQPKRFV